MALKSVIESKIKKLLVQGCEKWIIKFDPATGKFLESNGGWAVTNQDNIYLLAYLYLNEFEGNRFYRDPEALNIIRHGGNALRAAQRDDGKVLFIKVDGSTWGYIYMPWSMFNWLQAYDLMQGHLDAKTLADWKEGLLLAYDGIGEELKSLHIHNIPVWNAAAIFHAGTLFGRSDYKAIADKMIAKAIEVQHPDGFWAEHQGPTISYNSVYIQALGAYQFYGGTVSVVSALQKAFLLQQVSVYPDGTLVETADGRVKYSGSVRADDLVGYVGFDGGYEYMDFMLDKTIERGQVLGASSVNLLRLLERLPDGAGSQKKPLGADTEMILCHGDMQVYRRDGWQANLSSYTAPMTENRWGMDRQMFVSLWHKDAGLLIGGGNTKYIPDWSTFCVANKQGVQHVPQKGDKNPENNEISLYYGDVCCKVTIEKMNAEETVLVFGYVSDQNPDSVQVGLPLKFSCDAAENNFTIQENSGHVIGFKGYEITFDNCPYRLKWPVEPFNPYEAEGKSPPLYWAAVLNIDITSQKTCRVTIKKKQV